MPLDDVIMRSLSEDPKKRPSLREFREQIYEFVKRSYGKSLHLTEGVDKILRMTCNHAIFAVKQGDMAECLSALRYAIGKVRDPAIREELNSSIEEVEFRIIVVSCLPPPILA